MCRLDIRPDQRELNPRFTGGKDRKEKVVEVADAVGRWSPAVPVAGILIPALDRLKEEGLLEKLDTKICIGQGYRGKTRTLRIGS